MITLERPEPATPDAPSENPKRRWIRFSAVGVMLGAAVVVAGAFGLSRSDSTVPDEPAAVDARAADVPLRIGAGSIAETIERLEARVASVPGDDVALATLGIAYVEQARITGDASYYNRADDVLTESFDVNGDDNFVAQTGRAAVAAARHDFPTAESHALAGLEINEYNAALWGILSDAQIQLGEYDDGFASAERMAELSPDISSITRAAYVDQLRGDDAGARALMERALREAFSRDDRAFALFQIGELEMSAGDPAAALPYFLNALDASPDDISSLSGKAHALGQLGEIDESVEAYEDLLERAPLADFMIEFGEFLEGNDRTAEAEQWYDRARDQIDIDRSNGVLPDAAVIFFEADHGQPELALEQAAAEVQRRPFFELHEAHGWALYKNGRFDEAADAIERASALGINDPELFVRAALIHSALGDTEAARADLAKAREINPLGVPYLDAAETAVLDELSN